MKREGVEREDVRKRWRLSRILDAALFGALTGWLPHKTFLARPRIMRPREPFQMRCTSQVRRISCFLRPRKANAESQTRLRTLLVALFLALCDSAALLAFSLMCHPAVTPIYARPSIRDALVLKRENVKT